MPRLKIVTVQFIFNKLESEWSKRPSHEISRLVRSHEHIGEISQRRMMREERPVRIGALDQRVPGL